MTSRELAQNLKELGLTKSDLALLTGVTLRAVNMWLTEDREVPGPIKAYLRLLASVPSVLRAQLLAKLKQEDVTMYEGMYAMTFRGGAGEGWGTLVLQGGSIYGHDVGGARYDGAYSPVPGRPGYLDIQMKVTVPPGVALVTGVPAQPIGYWFDLATTVAARGESDLEVQTPRGPVRAVIRFVREVPNRLAN